MGISKMSAYTIAGNDVKTYAVGPVEGKYQGIIAHGDHPHHPGMVIISSDYYFDSEAAAVEAMDETVREIRKAVAGEGTAV
jgi:uncharacterized Zn-binding protein involved in type VI secretion